MQPVRYLCSMGEVEGPGIQAGDTRNVPDDEAQRLIEKDLAVAVKGEGTKSSSKAAGAKKATPKKSGTKSSSKAAGAKTPEG